MNKKILKSMLLTASMLLAAGSTQAHELFLKPDNYFLKPHSKELLKLVNGTFDKNLAIVARARMQDVSIAADDKVFHPPATDWHDADTASLLTFTTGKAGTLVAGVSTRPGVRTLSAADFRAFMKLYGALDGLASFDRDSKLTTVRQRSAKHVKAVVQVGNSYSTDFSRHLGYPLEVILKNNPYELKPNETLHFQVLHQGQPVANHLVYVNHAGFNEDDDAERRVNAQALRTDKNGLANFKISKKSAWYIALIHVHPVKDADADYETNWATLTFEMK